MSETGTREWTVTDWEAGKVSLSPVMVPVEASVELSADGRLLAVLHCTAAHLDELAIGYLLGQGLASARDEISSIEIAPGDRNISVTLKRPIEESMKDGLFGKVIYSGCGQGSGSALGEAPAETAEARIGPGAAFDPAAVREALARLLRKGELYRSTHAVHSAALVSSEGEIMVAREDIGRHNALDKVLGWAAIRCLDPGRLFVAATGRISSDAVAKLARFGVPLMVSRGVPTSMALEMAEDAGITLAGSMGPGRLRIYTNSQRLATQEQA